MTKDEFRKLQEDEATFPSVAAGGWPWRKFVPGRALDSDLPAAEQPSPAEPKPAAKPRAKKKAPARPAKQSPASS
jgi:hypothetical protein